MAELRRIGFAEHATRRPDFFKAPVAAPAGDELDLSGARSQESCVLVAEAALEGRSQPEVVGVAISSRYRAPAKDWMVPGTRAYLDELVVARACRRRGVGRALVDASRKWALEVGASELLLTAWSPNPGLARFYDRLGFSVISEIRAAKLR